MTTQRIDWPRVIRDLMERGMSQRAIGAVVGRRKAWVVRLRRGVRPAPRFTDGCRLLCLWCDVMGRTIGVVPLREWG